MSERYFRSPCGTFLCDSSAPLQDKPPGWFETVVPLHRLNEQDAEINRLREALVSIEHMLTIPPGWNALDQEWIDVLGVWQPRRLRRVIHND